MDPLLDELQSLVTEAEAAGIQVMVIGALALRTYLARPDLRQTTDVDLLVAETGRVALEAVLARRGFRVYAKGPWLRAERPTGAPRIVDVAIDAIVDLASFERYPLDPLSAVRRREPNGPEVPVPALEDLVAQKLIAAREKDALDVILVAMTATLDATKLATSIEARDLEIPVRRGLFELFGAARSGRLAKLWTERTGSPLSDEDLARALQRLETWFGVAP